MTYKVLHNALVNKVQTQAICNCRITARAVIWSQSRRHGGLLGAWPPQTKL